MTLANCSRCEETSDIYDVTGLKTISTGEQAPYQLCRECCKKLRRISTYDPADAKLRREFWEEIWVKLEPKKKPRKKKAAA